jgi:hypothetical protein
LIQVVTSTLGNRLYKVPAGTSVNLTPLQSIAQGGATALALFSLGSSTEFGLPQSLFNPSAGILCYADTAVGLGNLQVIPNFYMYDLYANTNVFATMVSDQQTKFNKFNANGSSSFLLSWTMTCQTLNCTGNNGNCINGMAQYANPQLATYIDQWTQNKTITASKIPNVLYLDYFSQYGDHAVDIAAALNTLYGPQRAG